MKRILLILNHAPNTGISVQAELLQKKLKQENYNVDIFNAKGSAFYRAMAFFKLLSVGGGYDVFHIHACSYFGFFPAIIGVFAGKTLKKKIIVTYHGGDAGNYFKKHTRLVRFFLLKSNVNIVLSGYLENVFQKYNIPCVIIPNILEFDGAQHKERSEIMPYYISVRSLNEEYNVQCIIKAFGLVVNEIPNAKLDVLGDGTCRKELKSYVNEHKIPNINFIGRVKNSEIYDYLSNADVFVSSPMVDNQPMSILEAYNAGLLVISSNVGGVPYMLEDRRTGLLFESDNHEELASKMLEAVQQQEQSKAMIKNAYNELKQYSWSTVRGKLLALYD